MHLRKQNQTAHPLPFLLIDSTDHISGKPGLSPTVTISKDGATFAAPAGAVTETGNGWYKVAGNATDENTLGSLILHATATGADPTDAEFQVVGFDPDSATNLGLSALPTNAVNTSGGLITQGNGAGQQFLDGSGGILVSGYQPIASPLTHSGQAQAGTATTITLSAAGASATDSIYVGQTIRLHTNTGAGQARVITGYVGSTKVATVDRAWQTNPSSTTLYTIFATDAVDSTIPAAIKAKTDNLPAAPAAVSDVPTATATADALFDRTDGVETGWTLRQVLRLLAAAMLGKSTNNGNTFRDLNDTKDRLVGTVDVSENRTAVTRDAT